MVGAVSELGPMDDSAGEGAPSVLRRVVASPESKILFGPRARWGTHGRLAKSWNVVENVPRDVLTSGAAPRRRRVVFRKGRGK